MVKKRNYVAVVIAGCTNGGKTSVSKRLLEKEFPNSIHISQDDLFFEPESPNHVWIELSNKIRHQDWERYSSVDWEKLDKKLYELDQQLSADSEKNLLECKNDAKETPVTPQSEVPNEEVNVSTNSILESIKKQVKLVLIEGHLVLRHQFPSFFKVDKKFFFVLPEEVCKKRRLTRNYIPPDPPCYYEEIVWPSYLADYSHAKANVPDALFINGDDEKEKVFQQIKKEIDDVYLDIANNRSLKNDNSD